VRDELGLDRRPPPPAPPPIDVASPLREEELVPLEEDREPRWSRRRLLLAFLDAAGGEAKLEEAVVELRSRFGLVSPRDLERALAEAPGVVDLGEDGVLRLNRDHPSLAEVRLLLREPVERKAWEAKQKAAAEQRARVRDREEGVRRRERWRWYAAARKALVNPLFDGDRLLAAAVLDPDSRTFRHTSEPDVLRGWVEGAEVVAGLDVRPTVERLGVDPNSRHLVDLGPPVRSRRLNRAGRTLRITPDLILRSTLDVSRPLGEPDRLARYAIEGSTTRLRRRLEADLKALWALYRYGQLHGCVRLRWGFLDEQLGVGWNEDWVPTLYRLLEEASETGRLVEVVAFHPPSWSDPWSRRRALRVERSDREWGTPFLLEALPGDFGPPVESRDVFEARLASEAAAREIG
jgi:hypothetical protein